MSTDDEIRRAMKDQNFTRAASSVGRDLFKNAALVPPHTIIHNQTHSLGIKPHPHNKAIARGLLEKVSETRVVGMDETVDISSGKERFLVIPKGDDRPLIDMIQWGTFGDLPSMHFASDKYALRSLLRKAHCFTLDRETSRLVADFSIAVATDLEAVRRLAVPPFPVTWFEIDNVARLSRIKELGVPLTHSAAFDPVPRVGWLITEAKDLMTGNGGGYYASYFCITGQGPTVAPLSYFWHVQSAVGSDDPHSIDKDMLAMCFGVRDCNVGPVDAFPTATPWQLLSRNSWSAKIKYPDGVVQIMRELSGELRHIWGALIALNAGAEGTVSEATPQPRTTAPMLMGGNKPLFPLEHKVLHIKLHKRATVEKIVAKTITGAKKRWHEVRGHFRTKLNPDGTVKWRIPIPAHERGDKALGVITKTYIVEK